ncbi:N-acetylmuramoyl-L-alanine amidase [Sinanaerobacter chloroacetimidivorans]|uniref:N-acetylmuramoyl-L-alanine amidase n=1 Tax=Sinanaerobacter chloroacetimidivorans TaxID=2818044 RepID=A0A8J7W1P1_9FIRM|nr:N-acetylmuramoyl-L-alanine amidase [Sinanaerobacter chloroacetimidivorans]MBR0598774.1 N-acetylmuramoyl-L-alanine amidase [Sinanaerobacter chloroacetimidivorans]
MARIYLSPSSAEFQYFITGGNEEEYMNQVADAMVPYLRASGIEFTRSSPNMTEQQIIDESNAQYYDLHVALNTDSAPEFSVGTLQGPNVIYYTGSPGGRVIANIMAKNLKQIYPNPDLVQVNSNRLLRELRDTDAAAVMPMLGYRDNLLDAMWITNNIDLIAQNLVMSIAEYLDVPFAAPQQAQPVTPAFKKRIRRY